VECTLRGKPYLETISVLFLALLFARNHTLNLPFSFHMLSCALKTIRIKSQKGTLVRLSNSKCLKLLQKFKHMRFNKNFFSRLVFYLPILNLLLDFVLYIWKKVCIKSTDHCEQEVLCHMSCGVIRKIAKNKVVCLNLFQDALDG